ncbi:MAG: HAMP domain-containing sensor histidine kinase [Dissulfuribacterales bacterium]
MITSLGLKQRLLLGLLALMLGSVVVFWVVGGMWGEHFLRSRFEDRITFLAHHLALNAELGMLLNDKKMLTRLAENILSEKDITAVVIQDTDGKTLVSVGDRQEGSNVMVSEILLRQQKEDPFLQTDAQKPRSLGRVMVYYSVAGMEELLFSLRKLFVWIVIAIAVIGTGVFYVFSHSLVAPLKELVQAARRVSHGDWNVDVKGGSLPETMELAEAFNQMLISLQESRQALEESYQEMSSQKALAEVGEFAFHVAHEVKNPLGIMKGAMDILKKPEVPQDTKITMIAYVEDEIRRLNAMIQDFLDFSRPRKPVFQPVVLTTFLFELLNRMELEWNDKGISLRWFSECDTAVCMADADMLAQAVMNVVKNACEACEATGRRYDDLAAVVVRLKKIGAYAVIEVQDNGSGIPEELRERILQPFFTTKTKGTGLGLSFVRRVIELHGGDMSFESDGVCGSVFRLLLPLKNMD